MGKRINAPQRSRRLSASGMRGGIRTRNLRGRLKEADAFQRLVCGRSGESPRTGRRASKKQTPFSVWYEVHGFLAVIHGLASKKQTPFSVWYRKTPDEILKDINLPQRSRRLSASGMHTTIRDTAPAPPSLKEADAFQRLVSIRFASASSIAFCLKEADAFQRLVYAIEWAAREGVDLPQRSRRLSASGIFRECLDRCASIVRLKEADAFQRLVYCWAG